MHPLCFSEAVELTFFLLTCTAVTAIQLGDLFRLHVSAGGTAQQRKASLENFPS
jgi:hypothetical protein